jgi:hypothetical protein
MTLGLCRKAWLAATLTTALAAAGCNDDASATGVVGEDAAAATDDAGHDDSNDAGAPLVTSTDTDACGACQDRPTGGSLTLAGCCLEASAACGLDVTPLAALLPESSFAGCQPRDRAGTPSDYCSAFFDQIDGTPDGAFALDTKLGTLGLGGCCTPDGGCGLSLSRVALQTSADSSAFDLGLGCFGLADLAAALGGKVAGLDQAKLDLIPFCDRATGQAPQQGVLPGLPRFLCGCGSDVAYDPEASLLPCFSYVAADVCGADEPDAAALAELPAFLCGCGEDALRAGGYPCLANLAIDACGGAVPSADTLGRVPEYVCGCGESQVSDGTCLSFVAAGTCGASRFDGTIVPGLPVYVCGCGDGERGDGTCIPNLPDTVCGGEPPAAGTIPGFAEYTCGCGASERGNGTCIPYVAEDVCGAEAVTVGTAPGVPEYVCGCGDGLRGNGGCIPNVSYDVCGAVPFTGALVPGVPVYRCGCGDGQLGNGLCIPNVPSTTCGASAASAGPIADYPEYLCGCGEGVRGDDTCLANLAVDVCGAEAITADSVPGQPVSACGCGDAVLYEAGLRCLSPVPTTVCGELAVAIDSHGTAADSSDDCVTGYPATAHGCGEGTQAGFPVTCISNVAASLAGCSAD